MIKKEGKKKALTKAEIEEALIDNFTNLQRVLTNLVVKFDDLSSNISKLLQVFEISAKSFAEKYSGDIKPGESDKEFLKKLDSLLDQNKTIAKGIMMMEDRIKHRSQAPQMQKTDFRFNDMTRSRPIPQP